MSYIRGPFTDWATESMTISATTTNPTKGTTAVDLCKWRRVGKIMEIYYTYRQTAAGAAGSGTYLFLIPDSKTIDTTYINASSVPSQGVVGMAAYGNTTTEGSARQFHGVVKAYDSTHLAVIFQMPPLDGIPQNADYWRFMSSTANQGSFGDTVSAVSFFASVPISGWD